MQVLASPRRVCPLRLFRPTSATSPSFLVATSKLGNRRHSGQAQVLLPEQCRC